MLAAHSPGPLRLASSWWQKQKATLRHRNSKANQRSLPSLLSNWQSKNASRTYSSKPRRGKLLQQLPRQQRQQSKRRMHSVNGSCSMQKMILSLSQRMNLARSVCHMITWTLSHDHIHSESTWTVSRQHMDSNMSKHTCLCRIQKTTNGHNSKSRFDILSQTHHWVRLPGMPHEVSGMQSGYCMLIDGLS